MVKLFIAFFRRLASPRFAAVVMLLMTVSITAAMISDTTMGKKVLPVFNSATVFSSRWFLALSILLLLITLSCTTRQAAAGLRRYRRFKNAWAGGRISGADQGDKVLKLLRKYRYKACRKEEGYWSGRKNGLGFMGSPLFHLGLAIIMLGVFTDIFAGFRGYLPLRPGLITGDEPGRYARIEQGIMYPGNFDRFELLLHDIKMNYYKTGASASGFISVVRENEVILQGNIDDLNRVNAGEVDLVGDGYGYYINYTITDKSGTPVVQHTQGLDTIEHGTNTEYLYPDYRQPGTPYHLSFRFFPDVTVRNAVYTTAAYEPRNPAIMLTAKYYDKTVYNGLVRAGQEAKMANGQRFLFEQAEPFLMVRVHILWGIYIITAGFVLFLAGLLLHYFCLPAVISVKVGAGGYELDFLAWTGREGIEDEAGEIEGLLTKGNGEVK